MRLYHWWCRGMSPIISLLVCNIILHFSFSRQVPCKFWLGPQSFHSNLHLWFAISPSTSDVFIKLLFPNLNLLYFKSTKWNISAALNRRYIYCMMLGFCRRWPIQFMKIETKEITRISSAFKFWYNSKHGWKHFDVASHLRADVKCKLFFHDQHTMSFHCLRRSLFVWILWSLCCKRCLRRIVWQLRDAFHSNDVWSGTVSSRREHNFHY